MHYYKFNIGDYASHTSHLSEMEDLAFRRMLDWHYLHESALPDCVDQIARLIRMRTHGECIAIVLHEFFELGEYGWFQAKAVKEIETYKAKSEKAKQSAAARWSPKVINTDANALRTECEGNANHKPLTINQEPLNNNHKPDKDISPSAQSATTPVDNKQLESDFDIYWFSGMAKNNKKKAFEKFKKLADKNGGSFAFANMLANDVKQRLASGQMGFDAMHPTTYLNNERWTDEVRQSQPLSTGRQAMPDRSALIAEASGDDCPFYGQEAIDHQSTDLLEGEFYESK